MTNTLLEIRKILKSKANRKAEISTRKFIPTFKKSYGVRVPILNGLANRFKSGSFELVERLWKSGIYEEQLLAAKILGKICKKDPERTINFIKNNINRIRDWAVCDTLATQGVRKIAEIKQKEIFEIAKKLASSKNFWQRRFGLVLLINFAKNKKLKKDIKKILKLVKDYQEPYIKKAINWLEKEIRI